MLTATYLEVDAGVRYWEDGFIDGVEDAEGKMPFRNGDGWKPVIDLATGYILDWPQGVSANIHYKVCDAGLYYLQDAAHRRVAQWRGHYVPDQFLCVGQSGFGDYIIFSIEDDGHIRGWTRPYLDAREWALLEG